MMKFRSTRKELIEFFQSRATEKRNRALELKEKSKPREILLAYASAMEDALNLFSQWEEVNPKKTSKKDED